MNQEIMREILTSNMSNQTKLTAMTSLLGLIFPTHKPSANTPKISKNWTQRADTLTTRGLTTKEIAGVLNKEGYRTARGNKITVGRIFTYRTQKNAKTKKKQ